MKMTLREAREKYERLLNVQELVLPAKMSYAIAYNTEKLEREVKRAEREREKLCQRYAARDENGKILMETNIVSGRKIESYKMTDADKADFNKELEDLFDTDAEIDIRMILENDICEMGKDARYNILSVTQRRALMFMTN
jgi:hypothetical protein